MNVAICFTNFGPYHLARLRALAAELERRGGRLIAYEVAGSERTYPWARAQGAEPFQWTTLFPDQILETIDAGACRRVIIDSLERDQPDAVGIVGYVRPESMAAARWARSRRKPAILLSESQEIDRPRLWWKELVKKRRLTHVSAALVGGPSHRAYLVRLGMPSEKITFGYNAVDHDYFAREARRFRADPASRAGLPDRPYFLSVSRFAPEKNLVRLLEAFDLYRRSARQPNWDLVLCGGGLGEAELACTIERLGLADRVHRPGFLQLDALPRYYAHAAGFVLASLSEPWGLVANEAAASGLPLLLSARAGCSETLAPEPEGTTGARFDPTQVAEIAARLCWLADLPEARRAEMGVRASELAAQWGPERFARGFLDAVEIARCLRPSGSRRPRAFEQSEV